ncbi:AI-2E family transporter [Thioflexithrix psekupsensis]|uniref:AI-2E family transporter n=1 Tax=Thioflexithrix psekupsensis TaxID=1570016 RepID=A0A251X3J7_9GAMM|nr:AI-2E family transporter [Thioflexithrix psekupsensis]OUD12064.1 hypothetical protein TPSD3_13080 [Thioflexithrix psekupsensis]
MTPLLKYGVVFSLAILIPLLFTLWIMPTFMVLLLGAILLAYILSPIVAWGERWHCGRSLSSFILIFVIPFILLEWLITILPQVSDQLDTLIQHFPAQYDQKIAPLLKDYTDLSLDWAWLSAQLSHYSLGSFGLQWFSNLFELILYALLFVVIVFILLRDWQQTVMAIRQLLHDVTPDSWNKEIDLLLNQMGDAISRLIRGQIEVSTLLAIYYGLSFHLIGQLAAQTGSLWSPWLLLGIVTGYLNLLPYIGVPLGGILVCVLGLMTHQLDVLWIYPAIIAVITLGTTVDHKLLTPRIIGRSVKVHEIFVYFAIYLGGALGGIVGILLALPVMAVVSVFVRYFYQHWLAHRQCEREQWSVPIDFSAKG